MRSVVTLAVAVCIASPAFASSWTQFFDCGQGDQIRHYSYQPASVRRHGQLLLVDIAGDYSQVRESRVAKARMVFAIDCSARTYNQQRRTEYGANGRVVARYHSTPPMTIGPPGIGQKLFERVCV